MKILFKVEVPGLTINKFAKLVTFCRENGIGYNVEDQIAVESAPKANGKMSRVGPTTRMMLGPNRQNCLDGSLSDQIVQLIEKHEKKHGPGSLTRAKLTEQLSEYSDAPAAAIGSAISKDIIRGIPDG